METFYVKINLPNRKEITRIDIDFLLNADNIERAILDAVEFMEETLKIKDFSIVEVRRTEEASDG